MVFIRKIIAKIEKKLVFQGVLRDAQKGMTMVELVTVLAIVALVSGVLIFNYSKFRNDVTVRGLSQEVALAIRKAQTYATSVRSIEGMGASTTSFPGYGISFSVNRDDSSDSSAPSKMQFILFAEIPDDSGLTDGMYNDGGSCGAPEQKNECLEKFTINSPDRIVKLCIEGRDCNINDQAIDIVFARPAPDAVICSLNGGSCDADRPSYIEVVLESPSGTQKTISVWNTGQISVQ